ncbi:hypothetical protein L596_021049 [Steinernema carpocapsae]|uniref:Uncharacterized protein n=1 Tax=Steinernema carpocapsae TaxID=34508 RepID=A0A4U5MVA0_STECR|nr:hypothetical protein L596_021049 [Steinernema carpocapsae]
MSWELLSNRRMNKYHFPVHDIRSYFVYLSSSKIFLEFGGGLCVSLRSAQWSASSIVKVSEMEVVICLIAVVAVLAPFSCYAMVFFVSLLHETKVQPRRLPGEVMV